MGLSVKEVGNILSKDELNALQSHLNIEDEILQDLWDTTRFSLDDFNDELSALWEYIYANDTED